MAPQFEVTSSVPPLSRTYWVLDGKFLAGAYPGHADRRQHYQRIQGLYGAGMRTFISLMEEHETNNAGQPFRPYADALEELVQRPGEIELMRFPIPDTGIPSRELLQAALDAIDSSLGAGRPVYLHCFGGIGRTGTAVCCWLLRHNYATKDNVFALLQELRRADHERASWPAPENERQRQFVRDWSEPAVLPERVPPEDAKDWFTRLTGFHESSPAGVRSGLQLKDTRLRALVAGKDFECGHLDVLSLAQLRTKARETPQNKAELKLSETVADVQQLHADSANAGALFQVASQFNLLEMADSTVTPEMGVTRYEWDKTQGPACAIACGAGTIYRNYFLELDGQLGQSSDRQVDCLEQIGLDLGNADGKLWEMRNGYCLPTKAGLANIREQILSRSEADLDELRSLLRVGIQWDSQVTLGGSQHTVTQAFCSALPITYSRIRASLEDWEPFARLVLEATYEATFAAATINAERTGNPLLFLTLVGGGAFGNPEEWILDAIERAVGLYRHCGLDVRIVSYQQSRSNVNRLIEKLAQPADGQTHKSDKPPRHYCPCCGKCQEVSLRYPWYICGQCLELATDSNGRRLEFANASLSGGLSWRYRDDPSRGEQDCGSVVCQIGGRPVLVTEARFGGVVAQPILASSTGLIDRSRITCLDEDFRRRSGTE